MSSGLPKARLIKADGRTVGQAFAPAPSGFQRAMRGLRDAAVVFIGLWPVVLVMSMALFFAWSMAMAQSP